MSASLLLAVEYEVLEEKARMSNSVMQAIQERMRQDQIFRQQLYIDPMTALKRKGQ
jgi:hypothetical protein